MSKLNHKSDFDFIMKLSTCVKGNDGTCQKTTIGWPNFNWQARLWTANRANSYIVGRNDDTLINCFNDKGEIHVVCKNHHLGAGRLNVEFRSELPREIYPDGIEVVVDPQQLDIELVVGQGDCATDIETVYITPYIKSEGSGGGVPDLTPEQWEQLRGPKGDKGDKGDAFTYEDFTPEQLEALRGPKGDKGDKGDIGPQGPAGPAGSGGTGFTTTDDLNLSADNVLSLTDMAKKRLFIDMWNTAFKGDTEVYGKYDPQNAPDAEHPFMGNDIWMTYEEAQNVMFCGRRALGYATYFNTYNCRAIKTNIAPDVVLRHDTYNLKGVCMMQGILETFVIYNKGQTLSPNNYITCSNLQFAFSYCYNLKQIIGNIRITNNTLFSDTFFGCNKLEGLNIIIDASYKVLLDISALPKLNLNSLTFLVNNREGTTAITIKVHADVYAKLTGDTTNAAAAALSEEELAQWMALATTAAIKNITFAK